MPVWDAMNRLFNPLGLKIMVGLVLMVCVGCNLSKPDNAVPTTEVPVATLNSAERPTRTPIAFGATERPTLLPLIDTGSGGTFTVSTPQPTLIPVTSVPPLGTLCQIYTTYSGVDPRNSLSLRTSASVSAPQVFRVPTNQNVFLVPGSGEIEADGYHWLNVIYVQSPQMRYQGWMARDSFSTNGVRDPSIATLRLVNAQAGC